jgi:cyclic pyranopterin phosphate synthase
MLIDQFGRHIDYLRVSLTDRCNFRCTYCMPEDMQFAPQRENLSSKELLLICQAFVELGVKKIRLTGGEPLIHPDFSLLLQSLSDLEGLERIAITTNGALLVDHIEALKHSKVKQLNISLDSVNPQTFAAITRVGKIAPVLAGIDAAINAGIERIRLNAVVSKGYNDTELEALVEFAIEKGVHIAFIEEMPMGKMPAYSRSQRYLSNDEVKLQLSEQFNLIPQTQKLLQSGPAKYYAIPNTQTEVGFISPHSNNFCGSCNRVRVTRKGGLVLCLGDDAAVDLRSVMRESQEPLQALKNVIVNSLTIKPESHQFNVNNDDVQVLRFMNVTGG